MILALKIAILVIAGIMAIVGFFIFLAIIAIWLQELAQRLSDNLKSKFENGDGNDQKD